MNRLAIAVIALSAVFFTACKKKEVADITVTYSVTMSNTERPMTVQYINETGGTDQEVISKGTWTKTFTLKSDVEKVPFEIWGSCWDKMNSNGTYQSQSLTLSITEDEDVKSTKSISGSSDIYISSYNDEVYAELPSAIKYKSKK